MKSNPFDFRVLIRGGGEMASGIAPPLVAVPYTGADHRNSGAAYGGLAQGCDRRIGARDAPRRHSDQRRSQGCRR